MSFHNIRDFGSSEDEAFLQNFESPMPSNDILADLCKVEDSQLDQPRKSSSKAEMQQEQNENTPEKNERKSKGRSKEKRKIFYRDKMAELMKPGEYIKQEYNYVAYTQYQQNKAPISKEEQLKRNRESAKNSRQRKKQYVTILEKKNEENSKLIEELIDKLEQVTMERDRLKEYNHHQVNQDQIQIKNFLKSKAEAYEQLNKVITNPVSTTDQIQLHISDMLQRFGTSGSERMAVINYYMNEVVEVLISDIHRYFLNSSAFSQGFTANNPPKNIDNQVMRILELDVTKITHIMQRYRQRFNKQASVFKGLTQEFYRIFKSVENQGKVIQLVFNDMIKELQCKRVGELIMWFQQNKFSRDIKRIRREWTEQLKTGEQVVEILRKQTKQT